MSRPTLSWPVSILAGAGIIIAVLLISSLSSPLDSPLNRLLFAQEQGSVTPCPSDYPKPCDRATAESLVVTQRSQSQTALSESQTARASTCDTEAYPNCVAETAAAQPSATTGSSGGNNNTTNNTPTFTATSTATRAATGTAASAGSATGTPTSTRTATAQAAATGSPADTSLPTPTPLIPADAPILICVSGERVEISGETRPNIPLIVYFDQRAVGGGTSTGTGSYLLRMQIGDEAPGLYLVEVRERGSRTLIQQLGCDVPAFTPTATVPLVP